MEERKYTINEVEPGKHFIGTKFEAGDLVLSRRGNYYIVVMNLMPARLNGWDGWLYEIRPAREDEILPANDDAERDMLTDWLRNIDN